MVTGLADSHFTLNQVQAHTSMNPIGFTRRSPESRSRLRPWTAHHSPQYWSTSLMRRSTSAVIGSVVDGEHSCGGMGSKSVFTRSYNERMDLQVLEVRIEMEESLLWAVGMQVEIEAFDAENIPDMVVGDLSSSVFDIPRAAKDVDIVLQLPWL
jgi:hypothetical protein